MGLDYSMQLIMSGVLNVTQLVGVITSLWTMDRFGRRPLLLWGSLCMTISHFIIAILVGLYSNDWPAHRPEGWVSVAFLLFYMISFGSSWGPVPWAMPSEIFPCKSSCSRSCVYFQDVNQEASVLAPVDRNLIIRVYLARVSTDPNFENSKPTSEGSCAQHVL